MLQQKRFLVWDNETHQVWLLGYPLRLTPVERQILLLVADALYLDAQEIFTRLDRPISKKSLPVHIHEINRKAKEIGGRRLIAHFENGYALNLQM